MKPVFSMPISFCEDVLLGFLPATGLRVLVSMMAIVLTLPASSFGAEYQIDSQKQFDKLRESKFRPGDVIYFKRGERFKGMFAPRGSGREGAPIAIKAYGRGPRPRIDAGGKEQAGLRLRNVQWYEVSGLEITNTDGSRKDQGQLFGIYAVSYTHLTLPTKA